MVFCENVLKMLVNKEINIFSMNQTWFDSLLSNIFWSIKEGENSQIRKLANLRKFPLLDTEFSKKLWSFIQGKFSQIRKFANLRIFTLLDTQNQTNYNFVFLLDFSIAQKTCLISSIFIRFQALFFKEKAEKIIHINNLRNIYV